MEFVVQLMLTKRCNLDCDYCYVKKENKDIKEEVIEASLNFTKERISKSEDITSLHLSLTGGEPFLVPGILRKSLDSFLDLSKDLGLTFQPSIQTNSTIFDEDLVKYVSQIPKLSLNISIDGYKAMHDNHRKFCNGNPSYEIVEKNTKKILKIFPMTQSTTVLCPEYINILSIKRAFNNLFKMGFRNMKFGLLQKRHDAHSLKAYFDLERKLIDMAINKIINGEFVSILPLSKNLFFNETFGINLSKIGCGAGRTTFLIDTDGKIYPCTICREYYRDKTLLGTVFFPSKVKHFHLKKCIIEFMFGSVNPSRQENNLRYFIHRLKTEKIYDEYLSWLRRCIK